MKYSIRSQFTLINCCLVAGTILLCWFINNTFLEDYYVRDKQQVLWNAYKSINNASSSGNISTEEFTIELRKICEKSNISVIVLGEESNVITYFGDVNILIRQLVSNIFQGGEDKPNKILAEEENYKIWIHTDERTQTEFMEIGGILDNGTYFLFRSALEGIRDSVALANRFLAYVGIGAAFLSGFIILVVSRKITDPIKELTDISQRMIHLDFEAKYQGNSKTELALLGNNINELSMSLEKTISELKSANHELLRDIQRKNEMDEMRIEFLSNVSHELKTPIALIQGYAEGLLENIAEAPESRHDYCEVIVDEADKMNTVVKKLLTLNELEFGKSTISMARIELTAFIGNCIQALEILVKQREIKLFFSSSEQIFVWADESKVEEVFNNYFTNALHHVPVGGRIQVALVQEEKKVRVSVFNEGEPIPEESLPLLWDKFYKIDKARTREYGGSGIGLSVVKAMMEAIHQNYGVTNQKDGVEFWFELERAANYEP